MKTLSDLLFRLNALRMQSSMEWKSSPPALNPAMQLLMKRSVWHTTATCDSIGVSKEAYMSTSFPCCFCFFHRKLFASSCTSTKKRIVPNLCWMQPPTRNTVTWPPFFSERRAEFVLPSTTSCDV